MLGKLQIPPLSEPQFPPLSRGPHRGRPCGSCRTRMQASSSQERQEGGPWVSSTLCAWPGVGCLPSTTCPFPGFPGANPSSGFKSVTHPLGFWGQWPGTSGPPVPGVLLLTWPGTSPPSVTGPLTLPCPSLSLFPLLWPFTCRAWLGAVPSRQDRQGRAVERPWAQSQIHLLDDLGRVPVPQFPCL